MCDVMQPSALQISLTLEAGLISKLEAISIHVTLYGLSKTPYILLLVSPQVL